MQYFAKSTKGTKSPDNEDSFALPESNEKHGTLVDTSKGYLFVVCDGMGGAMAGEVASQLCANWFMREFYAEEHIADYEEWLTNEIGDLNNRLFQLAMQNKEYHGMGTTLVSLLIQGREAFIHNVGDSRLYIFADGVLTQITDDDSPVWLLYKAGEIEKDQILTNKRKNLISKAIATSMSVDANSYNLPLPDDYIILLCTDGLTDVATDSQIQKVLESSSSLSAIAEALTNMALENESDDDITVMLVASDPPSSRGTK